MYSSEQANQVESPRPRGQRQHDHSIRGNGDIAPWSFYHDHLDKPLLYELESANRRDSRLPQPPSYMLPEEAIVVSRLSSNPEDDANDPIRNSSIPKRKKPITMGEVLQSYLYGYDDGWRQHAPLKAKEKISLPQINFNKKSSRLLPANFSPNDQPAIRSIFAKFSEEQEFDLAKAQKSSLLSPPKKRRRSNLRVLYSSSQLDTSAKVEAGIEVQGKRQRILHKSSHSPGARA